MIDKLLLLLVSLVLIGGAYFMGEIVTTLRYIVKQNRELSNAINKERQED